MIKFYTIVRHEPTREMYLVSVTNLFDEKGNDTTDLGCAHNFVAQLPTGDWLNGCTCDFEVYRLH